MILDNTTLKAAIANWLHRSDLTTVIPDFISLAEARLNRQLRVKAMETGLASTALVNGAISNPTGFLAWKELRYDGSPGWTLAPRPLEFIRAQPDMASAPRDFAVANTQTVCWPQVGNVKGTYYTAIPALESYGTNWLIATHPDLYLYAALEEAGLYIRDESAPMWAQRAQFLLDQIQSADTANALNGGPLTMRTR